jgi:hypothetical protein
VALIFGFPAFQIMVDNNGIVQVVKNLGKARLTVAAVKKRVAMDHYLIVERVHMQMHKRWE